MSEKLKNILIGLFALMAILIIVASALFLQPSIGDGQKTLNVRFSNISGINKGTRVTFAGKPIGEVKEILEVQNAREKSIGDKPSDIYFYELKLKVDSSVDVYENDIIAIQTTGLMGEKSIGIIPKAHGNKSKLVTNEVILAKTVDSIENTARQISQLSEKAEKTLDNFNNWFEKNSQSITLAMDSISAILNDVDNQKVITSVHRSINSFTQSLDTINSAMKIMEDNNTYDKLNILVDNVISTSDYIAKEGKETLHNLNVLTNSLTQTTGSIGKLINSEDMYLKFNALFSKANTLLNDINQYGILFQYAKGWQRQRTKRANILESLSTPQSFQEYFENEIAEITSSLGRINRLVEKTEDPAAKANIKQSKSYQNNFAYLLKQVESLLQVIKLYNENLSNAQ
jgi:phospholipid/cholesterol/gamma-HCH transport system substrate-binding protein